MVVVETLDQLFSPRRKYIIRLDENNFDLLKEVMQGEFPASYVQWTEWAFTEEVRRSGILNAAVYCEVNAYKFIDYCHRNKRITNMDSLLDYARLGH